MKENKISRRSFLKFGAAASAVGMMAAAPVAANAAQPDADAAADEENCLLGLFQKPKYIFLFIGDGMGTAQIQSARFYKGTVDNNGAVTEADLSFTGFPTVGSVTTYDSTSFCPDSASTATSIATGHKTESGVINMCPWTRDVPYETIAEKLHAQKGYKVGIISSVLSDRKFRVLVLFGLFVRVAALGHGAQLPHQHGAQLVLMLLGRKVGSGMQLHLRCPPIVRVQRHRDHGLGALFRGTLHAQPPAHAAAALAAKQQPQLSPAQKAAPVFQPGFLAALRQTAAIVPHSQLPHGLAAAQQDPHRAALAAGTQGVGQQMQTQQLHIIPVSQHTANNRAVARIDAFSTEYHEMERHLKNMGRAIQGKPAETDAKENGKIARVFKGAFKVEAADITC